MNTNESLLLEAISNMLSDSAQLGLSIHKKEETSHNAQFHYQDVEDKYRIKINDPAITLYDAINGAFYHTHSYKNIDDPQFEICFKKQMDGMSIPHPEQKLAIKYYKDLLKELKFEAEGRPDKLEHEEFTTSNEQSVGMADQKEMSQAINNK
jgi:hypothetical protein